MEKKKKIIIITSIISILILALVGFFIFMNMRTDAKKYNEALQTANKYYAQAEYEKAEDYYLQAINIDKKQVEPYIKIADTYIKLDKAENAKTILEFGLENVKEKDQKLIKDKLEEVETILNIPINNGGSVIKYKGKTYLLKYNDNSFEKKSNDNSYHSNFIGSQSIVCIDSHNNETVIQNTFSTSKEFWIYDDRIYYYDIELDGVMRSMKLDGSDIKDLGHYEKICGIDYELGLLIIKPFDYSLLAYNVKKDEYTIIGEGDFLALKNHTVYYDSEMTPKTIYSVNLNDNNVQRIAEVNMELNGRNMDIINTYIVNDTIYFSYGVYEFNDHYSSIHIAKINKDGSKFEIIKNNAKSGEFRISVDNHQIIEGENELYPFKDGNSDVYVYDNCFNKISLLKNNVDYNVDNLEKNVGSYIDSFNYTKDYIYYRIVKYNYNSSLDSYQWNQMIYYRKNLKTNDNEILYSIKP